MKCVFSRSVPTLHNRNQLDREIGSDQNGEISEWNQSSISSDQNGERTDEKYD
jgi:hypothetical protein